MELISFRALKIDFLTIIFLTFNFILVILLLLISQILVRLLSTWINENKTLVDIESAHFSKYPWLKQTKLIVINDVNAEAYSFSILSFDRFKIVRKNHIVISTGLIDLLDRDELEAVIAHEHAHNIENHTLFSFVINSLSKILFFIPIFRIWKNILWEKNETVADEISAKLTNKPISMAKAIYKITYRDNNLNNPNFSKRSSNKSESMINRINNLIQFAEVNNLTH